MSRLLCCVAVAAGIVWPAAAWSEGAQTQKPRRTRNILVKPDDRFGEVELELQLEAVRRVDGATADVGSGHAVPVGDHVVLCFRSSADGYVTVWSHDAEGKRAGADLPERVRGRDGRRAGRGGGGGIADRNELAQVERLAPVDQYLEHHLQRGPLPLQERRDGDQGSRRAPD